MTSIGSVPSSTKEIGRTLDELFLRTEQEDALHVRAAGLNVLAFVTSEAALQRYVAGLVDVLTLTRPCRLFALYLDAQLEDFRVSVGTRCHARSTTEKICSELIEIGVPPQKFAAVLSLLRANLLISNTTLLLAVDPSVSVSNYRHLAQLCDQVLFDSGDFEHAPQVLQLFSSMPLTPIDLQWVSLSGWREHIRAVFERREVVERLADLETIEIGAEVPASRDGGGGGSGWAAASLMMAGWLASRLELELRPSLGSQAIGYPDEGHRGRRQRVALHLPNNSVRFSFSFAPSDTVSASQLTAVTFHFRSAIKADRALHNELVRFERRVHLCAEVNISGARYRLERSLEGGERVVLIERYFSIGESITNYCPALQRGLALLGLPSQLPSGAIEERGVL